ncbi:MAG TPA: TIGR03790 family protein [Methylophilaceae bacterium]|nr:TIGR03790 family protein [Methylophilaceae bacterium]
MTLRKHLLLSTILFFCASFVCCAKDLSEAIRYRPSQLTPQNVAVIYNENDAKSVEIAKYYVVARQIPEKNIIPVKFSTDSPANLSVEEFTSFKQKVESHLDDNIDVILMVWTTPYAVRCNSITSAMTLGFDAKQCENTCSAGKPSPYFNSMSLHPYHDHKMRISMLLPTNSVASAKSLIDRSVLSAFSLSEGTGYFLKTNDAARSKPREPFFPSDLSTVENRKLYLRTIKADAIHDKKDVMFYFTGQAIVEHLDTLNFLPGAIADHLTSAGGNLDSAFQMPSTKWIEAGATGSYGTVSEPCNYWQKFPNPQVVLLHYLLGESLIEAYWKSVAWPSQGVFIGEPLATPYKRISN